MFNDRSRDEYDLGGKVASPGDKLVVTCDCNHEDWKTVLACPDRYPRLKEGDVVEFLTVFKNFYGNFARVRAANGKVYDLKFGNVEVQ